MNQPFNLLEVISYLKESKLVSRVEIKTHPHHFHAHNGKIIESELKGNVIMDIKKVLSVITKIIVKHEC
ncbi:MAG: hypothetical protein NUV40_03215 [Patescibacteria group bacterium]|nr:hypothetical protein [Patescibacteria group bacterium]